MSLADILTALQKQAAAQYGGASWWPAYQQAAAGGSDTLANWLNTQAPRYQDWTPDAAAFASKELAMQQEHTRNFFGANIEQSTADRIGSAGAKLGKAGMIVGGAIAGGVGLGAAGAGAAGATELGAGAGAADVGLGAGAAGAADAGVYGLSGIESAAAPGFTYGTAGAGGTAAAGTGVAAAAGPGEWADLSGWLGADTSGAPAYDATTAQVNGALNAGAGATAVPAGVSAAGTGTAVAGGGTALGRLMSGNGTSTDYASLFGNLGIAGLGYYGASRQADSLAGIAAENRADRMPFYAKSLEYLNNPSAYASGPGQAALQANLRALSVNGNPADNPALLGIATSSALRDWRDAVTGFGNIGLSGSDTRASLMSGATNADANALNALGYGLGSTLNPPSTIEQLLKQLKGAGVGLA